ncbi:hypothetical protein AB2B38_003000 [Balneola sp. MJW-20]|uniref:hypothetical protein n=1 Tax=Gracilimonas aurantiaca TaxID=3234185 RepID=UPI0034667499
MSKANKLSKGKLTLFYTLTLSVPLVILILIEITLRFTGYRSEYQELFIEIPDHTEYLITNPNYGSRYFPNFSPQVAPQPFLKNKSDNTFRVVVLGGSSTQGFPYHFYNSFSGRLEQKLKMNTQDVNIEVINIGMTAINSFALWDMKKEVAEIDPDAIVIYAGHNEYYGSFGVGSTQFGLGKSIGFKRLIIRLKNLRIYQLIEQFLKPEDDNPENRTMMARVVQESGIDFEGDVYQAGLEQFRSNMGSLLSFFDQEDIPVYIGSLASNLKGQSPLGENEDALANFRKGEELFNQGKTDSAYYYYNRSKELDEIRFRAPDAMNEIINDLSEEFSIPLVDTRQASFDSSFSGIPDDSFFDDHLHPNYRGNQVFGEYFYEVIKAHPKLEGKVFENKLSNRLPISRYEEVVSTLPILRLESGYPFVKGLSKRAEQQRFQNQFDEIVLKSHVDSVAATGWRAQRQVPLIITDIINYSTTNGDSLMVMDHYLNLAYLQLFNDRILKRGVEYAINNRNLDLHTANLLEVILSIEREDVFYPASLGTVYLLNDELNHSEYWLKRAEDIDSTNVTVLYNLARLKALQADTAAAFNYFRKYRNESLRNQQNQ